MTLFFSWSNTVKQENTDLTIALIADLFMLPAMFSLIDNKKTE
jgi:hypothetical protein